MGLLATMPAVGSSRISRRGSSASARAISTRRWSPYGSSPGMRNRLAPTPTQSSSASACSIVAAPLGPVGGRRGERREDACARACGAADHDVLERVEMLEQADVLERSADAVRGQLVRRPAGDALVAQKDLAARRAAARR